MSSPSVGDVTPFGRGLPEVNNAVEQGRKPPSMAAFTRTFELHHLTKNQALLPSPTLQTPFAHAYFRA